ncbi:hypothetical protein C0J52_18059 [Blattella germanica]|nr:hypothetical protein C0J52_18059 [Blattella germanica]
MKGEKASEASPRQEVNFIYDMCVSCPSSLTIETKVTTDEIDPFYIKQSYLTKGPKCDRIRDELFRCFLRNGNILIFRTDGTVQILALDGTVIHCREFQPPELPVAEIPAPSVDINALIETEEKVSKKKKAKTSAEPKNKKGRKGKKDTENEVQEEKVEEVQEKEAVPTPLPEILPLWDITEYEMWMAHGEKYRVTNGKKEKMEPPFLLRIATDFESGEVYTRREEGTNTLLKPNGTLIVAFPDGSRITATPKDDGEFEWTPEEEREIYEAALMSTISVKDSAKIESNFSIEAPEMTFSQVVDSSKLSSDMSSQDYKTGTTKSSILNVSTLESYVLITMKCTAEHPNYATVQSTSRTYVGLRGFQDPEKGDDIMSSTTDNWGNTFNVTYSGAAKHHMRTADESRDLSGIEFIHSDELENQLAVIEATQNASLTVDPMPGKAEIFNCYTMFMPLPKTESGKWIKTINLESHLPTNLKRKDLTRSTYGDPPSWLFPFPRQKKAKLKSTSAMTIQNLSSDEKFPKFLVVRIVHGLEAADHNIIDAVQTGLARYWQEAQNIYHKYDAYKMEDTRTPEEIELEDKLFELAVTQTPREVVEMYRKGINPANIIPDLKTTHKQSQHQMYLDAFYKKLEEDKENADFFRNLLKMKSVPKLNDWELIAPFAPSETLPLAL